MANYQPTGMLRPNGEPARPRAGADERNEQRARADLAAGVLDARTYRDVTIPRTNVRGRMRLLSRSEGKQVRRECRMALAAAGLDQAARAPVPEEFREWFEELVPRTLAIAVRVTDADFQLAPLEEWLECDDGQLRDLFEEYKAIEESVNPVEVAELSEAQLAAILDAAKKKAGASLISFGSSALASFIITSVAQRET